jgi:vancomycin resistance protein YoaR
LLLLTSAGVFGYSTFVEPTVKQGVMIGPVAIGGLTVPEAKKRVRIWWEGVKTEKLTLQVDDTTLKETFTAGQLGVTVDDEASIMQAEIEGLIGQQFSDEPKKYELKFKSVPTDLKPLKEKVRDAYGPLGPARVKFTDGKITRIHEKPSFTIKDADFPIEIEKAILGDKVIRVPLEQAPKKIPDEEIDKITEVVAKYRTTFDGGNYSRSSNIRTAAKSIDGTILMPGEKIDFNGTVGERTTRRGYKVAGVYKDGRPDVGVGGGICQVSTTLYNACLFANLKIVERTNHSLPVHYVPLGRDATVNWGAQNLIVQNNYPTPISIAAVTTGGSITFLVLGKKEPGQEVKITSSGVYYHRSGKSVSTRRVVYKGGKQVSTEKLGTSSYNNPKPKLEEPARRRRS